jgi:biotin synthase-like enzyme
MIEITAETRELMEQANKIHLKNFDNKVWFGRCIFLSWYCDVGDCAFCYRSTQKSRIQHAEKARRGIPSILVEAILAKNLGWRIEFLTGGYKIFDFNQLVDIAKMVSQVYGEKIWLNLGALKKEELEAFKPYVKGIVSSIEAIDEDLHNKICPSKPIKPYEEMFSCANDFKKSMTIVIGLGEKKEHLQKLFDFIEKHKLERITFYALRPVKGTPYTEGPSTEDYVWWIANTRIKFPNLQIIAGTAPSRVEEINLVLKAGANAITKFPATKMFNSKEANIIEEQVKLAKREFISTLTKVPEIDWDNEIEKLTLNEEIKQKIKITLSQYITTMRKRG